VDRRGFVPKGRTYATRTPFFVRLRWKDETSTGPCPLGILEHRGESAATAIILLPNLEVDPQLPYGQKLGQDDVCWFRASISPKFDAKPYTSTFLLRNAASVVANLTLLDEAQDVVPGIPTPPNGPEMKTELTEPLGNYFLTLGRSALTDTKFTMEWQSPLSYLRLTEPIELKIDNETGPDWPGADELRLNLGIDDEPLVSETWDDADTGESWPDLSKKIRDAVLTKLQMLVSDISFSDSLGMDVLKLDGLSAHGSAAGFIQHLHKYDKELEVRTEALTISDTFGDGQLTFKCTIAKFPSGQA
jgi:hypothetical protein